MKKDELGQESSRLLKKAIKGDIQSLAKLLTRVERDMQKAAPFLAGLESRPASIRLGITGPPGAGKSTLINSLVSLFRKANLKVAIIAIDPSSPFTGGAILG